MIAMKNRFRSPQICLERVTVNYTDFNDFKDFIRFYVYLKYDLQLNLLSYKRCNVPEDNKCEIL